MKEQQSKKLRSMIVIALFAAMAYVAMLLLHIKVSFLTLDVKDAVITLCGLYFGPMAALIVSVIVPLLELITVSSTGFYGLIMNILGSVSFSVTASLIYKWKKTFWGAIVALLCAMTAMTSVMLLANLLITPYYMGVTVSEVWALIPTLLLPFNAVKAALNAGVVLLLYKQLSGALRRARVLPPSTRKEGAQRNVLRSLLVILAACLLIAACAVVIFAVLGGKVTFGA